jgi:hypothetical protein
VPVTVFCNTPAHAWLFSSHRAAEENTMVATVGDRVQVQRRNVETEGRLGTVEVVLSQSPPRYQVRWDNGRWSIISANDGSLRVVARRKRAPRRGRTATPKKP